MATNRTAQVIEHLRKAALVQEAGGLTDGQLLGCFIHHRDEAALAAILKRHGPMVWGVCRRLLPHHEENEKKRKGKKRKGVRLFFIGLNPT